ncbi:hypothetical protein MEA186_01501 [Mesorhizobium amorphae CCNWGS0123]|uniref:Uncharacterized protein n=1 Tax=Mesorhizobium amorphae CCNWGS0123 TaxID=1082933 RepID=G6Y305_9HYPH|nr:hypothetical protein MEA186_01501 [Mesorhizobium amorphae CCNWGS0123]
MELQDRIERRMSLGKNRSLREDIFASPWQGPIVHGRDGFEVDIGFRTVRFGANGTL